MLPRASTMTPPPPAPTPPPPPLNRDILHFPPASRLLLQPYLPGATAFPSSSSPISPFPPGSPFYNPNQNASIPQTNGGGAGNDSKLPFLTLTFATSLDSALALRPGTQTVLSGPFTKAMTHYLRSRHDAILVGVGTVLADNPSLNCRLAGTGGYGGPELQGQPRPVVLDPNARWDIARGSRPEEEEGVGLEGWKVLDLSRRGKGRAPWVLVAQGVELDPEKRRVLEAAGGMYIHVPVNSKGRFEWKHLLFALGADGIGSVMVEGGGEVINSLLSVENHSYVGSVVITVAPTWLGQGGVVVSPPARSDAEGRPMTAARLKNVRWCPFGEDVVLCGKIGDV